VNDDDSKTKWIEVYFKVLPWHLRGPTEQTQVHFNEIYNI